MTDSISAANAWSSATMVGIATFAKNVDAEHEPRRDPDRKHPPAAGGIEFADTIRHIGRRSVQNLSHG
jgi:hypothetical protein